MSDINVMREQIKDVYSGILSIQKELSSFQKYSYNNLNKFKQLNQDWNIFKSNISPDIFQVPIIFISIEDVDKLFINQNNTFQEKFKNELELSRAVYNEIQYLKEKITNKSRYKEISQEELVEMQKEWDEYWPNVPKNIKEIPIIQIEIENVSRILFDLSVRLFDSSTLDENYYDDDFDETYDAYLEDYA